MNIAVIFAGGIGSRFKMVDIPKQFMKVNNKEILVHTLEKFENNSNIDKIIIVMVSEWIEHTKTLINKYNIKKVDKVVAGGETGQKSIYNGLSMACELYPSSSVVLIHDGVRPIVDDDVIDSNIETVKKNGNAITVSPAIETILTTNEGLIEEVHDRSRSWYAKAPQSFILGDIIDAHLKAIDDDRFDFIDSASLMTYYGFELNVVVGSSENIKVTTNKDYYMMKAILENND